MSRPPPLPSPSSCWACGAKDLAFWKNGNAKRIESASFAITDLHYGTTGTLYRCRHCHFAQCIDFTSVTNFYEGLIDPEYENTCAPRALQARRLLDLLPTRTGLPTLLDIGAGSGILLAEATRRGWSTVGIEPSKWLAEQAKGRGLAVHAGVLPHAEITLQHDYVTLIDVLEHVTDPLDLLLNAKQHLSSDGIGMLVTPDAGSLTARIAGFRWWHYRIAHVGYFNRNALTILMRRAGLELISWARPTWYFPLDYLWVRLGRYLPYWPRPPNWTRSLTIPVNLFDSFVVTFRIAKPNEPLAPLPENRPR